MAYKKIETKLPGVVILEPQCFGDHRGWFMESWSQKNMEDVGINVNFVQDNQSFTAHKGTIRGIHYQQNPMAQAKLVRVVRGAVVDVAVDIRKGSPTFGRHVAVELTEENHRQLFIPRGFAHGFAVLSDVAVFQYKCDNFYHPEADAGIQLFDEELGIDWRIPMERAILSEKDLRHARLADVTLDFDIHDKLY